MRSFPAFLDSLTARHGAEAAAVRHELYFQAQRPWPRLRALAALLRDLAVLWRPGRRLARGAAQGVLFAATLPGANGWGCLQPAVAAARQAGLPVTVVAHPRLGGLAPWLPRPPLAALAEAGRALLRSGDLAVGAALARRALWRAAWRAALGPRGTVVLHNDFDMMSAAALDLGWRTVCLQHGVPTDEFFPCRADLQVVWGDSSAAVYHAAGCSALVVDALGRGAAPTDFGPPSAIVLVSQSHTTVYGPGLAERFRALAAALPAGTRVLLHPGEAAGHCYDGLAHLVLERPPHALLSRAGPRCLVVGFCSTALLDAACAGHDVVGLDWPAEGSGAALTIAAPPRRLPDASAVADLFHRLCRDAATRAELAAERQAWLRRTFSPRPGGFVAALR